MPVIFLLNQLTVPYNVADAYRLAFRIRIGGLALNGIGVENGKVGEVAGTDEAALLDLKTVGRFAGDFVQRVS